MPEADQFLRFFAGQDIRYIESRCVTLEPPIHPFSAGLEKLGWIAVPDVRINLPDIFCGAQKVIYSLAPLENFVIAVGRKNGIPLAARD